MAEQSAQPSGDWSWLPGDRRPLMGALIFARGVALERMIEVFGLDPGSAQLVPENRLDDALAFPVYDDSTGAECPYVRVGQTGEWAFASDEQLMSLRLAMHGKNLGKQLSAGTDVVVVSWTAKPTEDLEYWEDGTWVTAFEPSMPWGRSGYDPDRFLPQMREVGLETERPSEPGSPQRVKQLQDFDHLVAALDMVTLALGIRLPEEVIRGPLLTAQFRPGEWPEEYSW